MATSPFEAFVERGQIRLPDNVKLPEKTKVFVLVADSEAPPSAQILSPRLVHREQAKDFVKQIIEALPDAAVGRSKFRSAGAGRVGHDCTR